MNRFSVSEMKWGAVILVVLFSALAIIEGIAICKMLSSGEAVMMYGPRGILSQIVEQTKSPEAFWEVVNIGIFRCAAGILLAWLFLKLYSHLQR